MQDRNCKKLKPLYHLKKQPLNNIYFYFNPCRPSYTANIDDGELENGFVPSWVKDDPRYREYDTCKCRYSFNCPSSGLKFVRNMEKWHRYLWNFITLCLLIFLIVFLIREAAPRIKNIAALIAESIQRWSPDDTDKDNILHIRYHFIDIDFYSIFDIVDRAKSNSRRINVECLNFSTYQLNEICIKPKSSNCQMKCSNFYVSKWSLNKIQW